MNADGAARMPLFARLLGAGFETLPEPVRMLHSRSLPSSFRGRASVRRGSSPLARLCAAMAHLPPGNESVALCVTIASTDDAETWRRDFDGHLMCSTLRESQGELHERLGAMRFRFRLQVRDGGIEWYVVGVRALGVPLPQRWFAGVRARESSEGARYRFDVRAALPLVGLLIHYTGTLDP